MFDRLLSKLLTGPAMQTSRAEGVSFFKVAKDLYDLASLDYLGLNIPLPSRPTHYAHCTYSDSGVRHCIGNGPVCLDLLSELGLTNPQPIDSRPDGWLDELEMGFGEQALAFLLRSRFGETAIFGITAAMKQAEWQTTKQLLLQEMRVLANYFHGHVLRINGHNAGSDLLISARELDCLKWTAAGKTAWEASVILGISERTVRFHLNAAREKLQCATTTQAVAKAIVNQLIDV
jgi:DNA-binding CsgD family transcriptional regulator